MPSHAVFKPNDTSSHRAGIDHPYVGTLLSVRDQFRTMNIPLGYVQLDSWFYPKGHEGRWKSEDPLGGGTYLYEASRELFTLAQSVWDMWNQLFAKEGW